MPFTLEQYANLRPYAFHLTAAENFRSIRSSAKIFSTSFLLHQANVQHLGLKKRRVHLAIDINGDKTMIRDQAPLHEGNMILPNGLTFEWFVQYLNERVFFWPGNEREPIPYGRNHFERYRLEDPYIIRVETAKLIELNSEPFFSSCNSGSPRCNAGKPVKRGPDTFLTCRHAPFTPGEVKELVFINEASLGAGWKFRRLSQDQWQTLEDDADESQ